MIRIFTPALEGVLYIYIYMSLLSSINKRPESGTLLINKWPRTDRFAHY